MLIWKVWRKCLLLSQIMITIDSFGNIILQPFEESEFQKWAVQIQK